MSEKKKITSNIEDITDLIEKKMELLMKIKSGQSESISPYRKVKKQVARTLTAIRAKELN